MSTTRIYRFHQYGGPEVLQLESVPTPQLSSSEVRVRDSGGGAIPDWGEAAQQALELLLPLMALLPLLADIQHLRPLAKSYGLDINLAWCKK